MRVGTNNKWGYSFKDDSGISLDQQAVLGANLARIDGGKNYFKDTTFLPNDQEHDLIKDVYVLGIEIDINDVTTLGIVWGISENQVLEACTYTAMEDEHAWFPYKIEDGYRYFVKDGELYRAEKK